MTDRIVPDTSIIIDGKMTELAAEGRLRGLEILVPELVVEELEQQANKGQDVGYTGIDELRELYDIAQNQGFTVSYVGHRASAEDIELANDGRLDAMIRDIAEDESAELYTADYVQYRIAQAKGIPVTYFDKEQDVHFSLQEYFTEDTMSVHLKQGDVPRAKRGSPQDMTYKPIGEDPVSKAQMQELMKETLEKAQSAEDGLVEMNYEGATVVQIGNLRIAMSSPPFSEGREITAVRPLVKVGLDDYDLSDKLRSRLAAKAEGILIAGAPGHGKSTFAQALAEFYEDEGKVVKTMEHPRDLQVGPEITQYAKLDDDFANTGDFLLLVRPDYTVYDEVRKTEDFEVFSDMRLAGVGMIGVVHASEALDAIQRMIGRVELGVIPQIVDTVVFIRNAEVTKVYKLELTVKVPEGMMEADLARPVVLVQDFESDEAEYEIYTYGEETVVMPVSSSGRSSMERSYAEEQVEHLLSQHVHNPDVEFTSDSQITVYVDESKIGSLIGKNGDRISQIEDDLGLTINVAPRHEKKGASGGQTGADSVSDDLSPKEKTNYHFDETNSSVVIMLDEKHAGKEADFLDDEEYLFTATIGKNGQVKISKDTEFGADLMQAFLEDTLTVYV